MPTLVPAPADNYARAIKAIGEAAGPGQGESKRGLAALFRSGKPIDVDMLRKLPALPETADELREMARALLRRSTEPETLSWSCKLLAGVPLISNWKFVLFSDRLPTVRNPGAKLGLPGLTLPLPKVASPEVTAPVVPLPPRLATLTVTGLCGCVPSTSNSPELTIVGPV